MILVDASMVFHRCYHAMDDLKTTQGLPTGLEYGSIRILESLTKKYRQRIVVCYDSPGTWRRKKDERYKANRHKHDTAFSAETRSMFHSRCERLKTEVLDHEYDWCRMPGQEADDLLYTLAKTAPFIESFVHYVYTNDSDMLQTVGPVPGTDGQVVVLKSHQNSIYEWDYAKVFDTYRVPARALPLYRALVGDPSDNLEGVKRVPKEMLAECVRFAYCTAPEGQIACLRRKFEELREADRWTETEWSRLTEFLASGILEANYSLMRLSVVPGVEIVEAQKDDDAIRKFMQDKEIRTLDVCKRVFKGVVVNEEF